MKTLSIGYFADGPWAHDAFDRILSDASLKISFVVPRFDSPDAALAAMAERAGIPVLKFADVNAPAAMERIGMFGADLLVSMSFNQIIRPKLIGLPPLGFINCHAGRLPFYRGRNVLNWAIINGEKNFGITVHYIDEGIDTGDIILQENVPITSEDDYGSVLEKAYRHCGPLLHRAIKLIGEGKADRISQRTIDPVGFYCGRRREGDEEIDWSLPSAKLHDFIRGITLPGPCARTWLGKRRIAVVKSSPVPGAAAYIGTEGEVVGKSAEGNRVKTGDSVILITQVSDVDGNGKTGNVTTPHFPVGSRFTPAPK